MHEILIVEDEEDVARGFEINLLGRLAS